MIDNGSPEPEFYTDDDRTHFLTVLPANMEAYEDEIDEDTIDDTDKNERVNELKKTELQILLILKENPSITQKDISDKTKLSEQHIRRIIKSLKDKNIIKRIGSAKTGHWEVINTTS